MEITLRKVNTDDPDVILAWRNESTIIPCKMHGKSIASIAFRRGSELVRKFGFAQNIFAYIRSDNIGSIIARSPIQIHALVQ